MAVVRALIVDDHALLRSGLRLLLEAMTGVEVLGEAGNGREAIALIGALRPSLVLMDIEMPELNGIDAAVAIQRQHPDVKLIILSSYSEESRVLAALRAGANGYLLKSNTAEDLGDAVRVVARGGTFLSPSISGKILARTNRPDDVQGSEKALTSRQREVLQLIAEGKTTKEIAFLLNIGAKTVETHRAQLMDRLQIRDIPGLVKYAMRAGLISSDLG